jgi:hypothetical protein
MKRPVGVILTSIVLGLCAGIQLLMALSMLVITFGMSHLPAPPLDSSSYPSGYPPAPEMAGFINGVVVAEGVFFLLLAAWAIATLVGLVRLRNWARYSVVVIGGCLVALGGVGVLGLVMFALFMPASGLPTNLPPHTMQFILVFEGFLFALMAALGVWWLVYFNLRSVKEFFLPANPAAYGPGHSIDPRVLSLQQDGTVYPPPPKPSRFARVPVPLLVLACLLLLAGVWTAFCGLILPFPAFLFGFVLHSPASRLLFLSMGIITVALGIGLLGLREWARLDMFALMGFGSVHMIVMATPWGRGRMVDYLTQLYDQMHMGSMAGFATSMVSGPMMIFSGIMWLAMYGVMAWILYHYRGTFTAKVETQAAG